MSGKSLSVQCLPTLSRQLLEGHEKKDTCLRRTARHPALSDSCLQDLQLKARLEALEDEGVDRKRATKKRNREHHHREDRWVSSQSPAILQTAPVFKMHMTEKDTRTRGKPVD